MKKVTSTLMIFWVCLAPLFALSNFSLAKSQDCENLRHQLRSSPQFLLVSVYVDPTDPPELNEIMEKLDQAAFEIADEIGLRLIFRPSKSWPMPEDQDLRDIKTQIDKAFPLEAVDLTIIITNRTEPSALAQVIKTINFGPWKKQTPSKVYGQCDRDNQIIALYDFSLQTKLNNAGGKSVAISCLKHELGHFLGLEHNPDESSIMLWNADSSLGIWTSQDLKALIKARVQRLNRNATK